eukprot:3125689-Heterocapsa_arctica.AAC.1
MHHAHRVFVPFLPRSAGSAYQFVAGWCLLSEAVHGIVQGGTALLGMLWEDSGSYLVGSKDHSELGFDAVAASPVRLGG